MSDPFLELHRQKQDRKKRGGEWVENFIFPRLIEYDLSAINLEIGCGHGHWLVNYSQTETSQLFVGIDLISKRIKKAASKVTKQNLKNIFFYKAEATEFIECLDTKISKTFIMYPDPWPKHKHHKRRLIQLPFLKLLYSRTLDDGEFYFKTDHSGYFEWATSMVSESTYWKIIDKEWPHKAKSYFSELLPKNQFFCARRL